MNEFMRDIYDFDKEIKKERKEIILDKIYKKLNSNYKELDWVLKLEFFKRQLVYYEENKDSGKILQILEEIFKKFGYNEETYKIKGDYYFFSGQLLLAKENYLKALDVSNNKVYFFLKLAEIEKSENNLIEARQYYKLITEEESENAYYISLLGEIEEELEQYEEAKKCYEKAIDNSINSSYYLSLLGKLEKKLSNLTKAQEYFIEAMNKSPNDGYYLNLLGQLKEELEQYKEAK